MEQNATRSENNDDNSMIHNLTSLAGDIFMTVP